MAKQAGKGSVISAASFRGTDGDRGDSRLVPRELKCGGREKGTKPVEVQVAMAEGSKSFSEFCFTGTENYMQNETLLEKGDD